MSSSVSSASPASCIRHENARLAGSISNSKGAWQQDETRVHNTYYMYLGSEHTKYIFIDGKCLDG